jgi:hypothetical protein
LISAPARVELRNQVPATSTITATTTEVRMTRDVDMLDATSSRWTTTTA